MPACRSTASTVPSPAFAACALLAAALPLGGCEIIFPDACPDLDEVCPDLRCDDYKQNRDGCSICECEEGDAQPTVCWDDADCAWFEALLEEDDADVMAWVLKTQAVPRRFAGPWFDAMQKLDYVSV